MKVNWFSPLLEEKSEVARYSVDVITELKHKLDLTVYCVEEAAGDERCTQNLAVKSLPITDTHSHSINLYHIGNNALHGVIAQLSKQKPGVTVLHDCCLQDLAFSCHANTEDEFEWKQEMRRHYGDDGEDAAERYSQDSISWADLVEGYPLFQPFIANSLGVIVHSDYALNIIKNGYCGEVVKLNLPYRPSDPFVNPKPLKATSSIFTIVFCGHAGVNRRLHKFIEAWGLIGCPERYRLDLYGHFPAKSIGELERLAEEKGLKSQIYFKGYVSDAELDRALREADLAVNLRNPTMGEASASLLRYWDYRLATIVSDIGWYSECPENTVFKVPVDDEVRSIARILGLVLDNPHILHSVGDKGYNHLKRYHQLNDYVDGMVSFLHRIKERCFIDSIITHNIVKIIANLCPNIEAVTVFNPSVSVVHKVIFDGKAEPNKKRPK